MRLSQRQDCQDIESLTRGGRDCHCSSLTFRFHCYGAGQEDCAVGSSSAAACRCRSGFFLQTGAPLCILILISWLAVITFCDAPSRKLEVDVLCRTVIQGKSYRYISLLSAPRELFRAVLCPACALRLQNDPSPQCHLYTHFHVVFVG